jgi:hypothetical protein
MALTLIASVSVIVWFAFWACMVIAGIWAYRHLRLPSVPWLAAYLVLSSSVGLFVPYLTKGIIDGAFQDGIHFAAFGMTVQTFTALIIYAKSLMGTLCHALIAWFVMAEFAFLLSRSSLGENLTIPKVMLVPRRHAAGLGTALLGSCLVLPVLVLGMWAV